MVLNDNRDRVSILESAPDSEFPEQFVQNMISVFEHSRDEINELLKIKSMPVLEKCRSLVFNELVLKLPQFAGRQLYARRKAVWLIEDIYLFSFSAINSLPDKHLSKCFKQQINFDLDTSRVSVQDDEVIQDSQDTTGEQTMIEMYVKLQDRLKSLEAIVKSQAGKIESLEKVVATNKQKENRSESKTTDTSMDQGEGGGSAAVQEGADLDRAGQPSHSGDEVKSVDFVNPSTQTQIQRTGHEDGFRHSTWQRKNILKGGQVKSIVNQPEVKGTSHNNFDIKACVSETSGIYAVYVGKLQHSSTTEKIRAHLNKVKIGGVADVISLNNRPNKTEASFCVSLNDEESAKKIFNPSLWPSEVLVRPFRPSRGKYRSSRYRHTKQGYRQQHYDGYRDTRKYNRSEYEDRYEDQRYCRDDWEDYRYSDYGRRY